MKFDLVTPEKMLLSTEATSVKIPGSEGYFGVLEGHQPMLASLKEGTISVETAEGVKEFTVTGGFADVSATAVTVLAKSADEVL